MTYDMHGYWDAEVYMYICNDTDDYYVNSWLRLFIVNIL